MQLNPLSPLKSLDRVYKKESPVRAEFDQFTQQLGQLHQQVQAATEAKQSEENLKTLLSDFLKGTFYSQYPVNTFSYKGLHEADLVIRSQDKKPVTQVLFEVKRPGSQEMMTLDHPNRKALHEAITYYLWEREEHGNRELRHIVITDLEQWFLIDSQEFYRCFGSNRKLVKFFHQWREGKTDSDSTSQMYQYLADMLASDELNLEVTHFRLADYVKLIGGEQEGKQKKLIALFKLLSIPHLLKEFSRNDSNELNKDFYYELLYILGLEEEKQSGKKVIGRAKKPQRATLIESARAQLKSMGLLSRVQNRKLYGSDQEEQLQGVALELAITWTNRILFLKLLEAQLITYHEGDRHFAFLSPDRLNSYDEVNSLFFEVLAEKPDLREPHIREAYSHIPYLNSSLFEATELEKDTFAISGVREGELPVYAKTVLRDAKGKSRKGEEIDALRYLLEFLDAYDFGAESHDGLKESGKTLINASVLGLIFEKINGYKEGSFFTPGFITTYMARETLRQTVLDKFNQRYEWECQDLDQLYNRLDRVDILEANQVIDALTICDPAVGSGHFLVSCLNELLAIKSKLGILADEKGKRLRDWIVRVEQDELIIEEEDGRPFVYQPPEDGAARAGESQRVQQTLFNEKRKLIENCLFGVDINPNSVKICRLRLWIELLKHAYYSPESQYTHLETLPNLDINIKVGNSLVSRFGLQDDLKDVFKKQKYGLGIYRAAVSAYRRLNESHRKQEARQQIEEIKAQYRQTILNNDPRKKNLAKWRGQIDQLTTMMEYGNLLGEKVDKKSAKQEVAKLQKRFNDLQAVLDQEAEMGSALMQEAFDWRFEFPEVLDEEGNFLGFDVMIANPPYIRQEELKEFKPLFQQRFQTYAGTADLYVYFVELGMDLLRKDGHFCYIFPNKWMRAGYGKTLRQWMPQYRINSLIDFGDLPVFEEATTYPIVLNLQKTAGQRYFPVAEPKTLDFGGMSMAEYLTERWFEVDSDHLDSEGWSLVSVEVNALLQKLRKVGTPLGEYVNGRIYRGVLTGLNEAFVIDRETRDRLIEEDPNSAEVIKPFLAGKDIKRWRVNFRETYLVLFPSGWTDEHRGNTDPWAYLSSTYPAVARYLNDFETKAKKRYDQGKYWWELRACDYYDAFEEPKVMYQEIATFQYFAYDQGEYYANNKVFILPGATKAFLGFLNSKVTWFYLNQVASKLQGGALAMQSPYVLSIPLHLDIPPNPRIEALVEEILAAKAADPSTDTQAAEAEIDQLVYQLYGLSEEEVRLVEGK